MGTPPDSKSLTYIFIGLLCLAAIAGTVAVSSKNVQAQQQIDAARGAGANHGK